MSRFELEPGEHLFRQGDESSSMYLIESGHIDVELELADASSRLVARLGPGENLGENSLLAGTRRSASAVAHEPATGWMLYREGFEMLRLSAAAGAVELMARLTEASVERLGTRYGEIARSSARPPAPAQAGALAGAAPASPELASAGYLRGLLCFHEFFDDSQITEVIGGAVPVELPRGALLFAPGRSRATCCSWSAAPSTSRCAAPAARSGCGSRVPGGSWATSVRCRDERARSPRTRASGWSCLRSPASACGRCSATRPLGAALLRRARAGHRPGDAPGRPADRAHVRGAAPPSPGAPTGHRRADPLALRTPAWARCCRPGGRGRRGNRVDLASTHRSSLHAAIAATLAAALFAAWVGLRVGGEQLTLWIDDVGTALAAALALMLCLQARACHAGRMRLFWTLLSCATACWTMAEYHLGLLRPDPGGAGAGSLLGRRRISRGDPVHDRRVPRAPGDHGRRARTGSAGSPTACLSRRRSCSSAGRSCSARCGAAPTSAPGRGSSRSPTRSGTC